MCGGAIILNVIFKTALGVTLWGLAKSMLVEAKVEGTFKPSRYLVMQDSCLHNCGCLSLKMASHIRGHGLTSVWNGRQELHSHRC